MTATPVPPNLFMKTFNFTGTIVNVPAGVVANKMTLKVSHTVGMSTTTWKNNVQVTQTAPGSYSFTGSVALPYAHAGGLTYQCVSDAEMFNTATGMPFTVSSPTANVTN